MTDGARPLAGVRVVDITHFLAGPHMARCLAAFGAENLAKDAPLGRLGDDEDLKGAVVLFASDAGKHISGQILAVDGGVSAV